MVVRDWATGEGAKQNHGRSLLITLVLAAFALRMAGLNERSLWVDEAFEFWSAELPLAELPSAIKLSLQPPLYTFLLHWWLAVGITPTWLRFLSVALSMGGVVALLHWANRELDNVGLLITGALISTMPLLVRYAQEVGEYALLFCTLAWMIYLLSRTFARTDWGLWFAWMAWSVLSVYSHYGALLILAALSGAAFVENLWRQRYRALYQQTVVSLLGLLLLAPLLSSFFWAQFLRMHGPPTLSSAHFSPLQGSFVAVRDVLLTLWINSTSFESLPLATQWLGQLWLILLLLACAYILAMPGAWSAKRIILWFWLAFLVYYFAVKSDAYAYGLFGGRYSLILAPLFVLAGGALVTNFLGRVQTAVSVAFTVIYVCLALTAFPQSPFYRTLLGQEMLPEAREEMQPVFQAWLDQRRATEPTYIYDGAVFAFGYYLKLAGLETRTLLSERNGACRDTIQPGCQSATIFYGRGLRNHPATERVAAIWQAMGRQPDRFWLIFSHVYEGEDRAMLTLLSEQYTVIATYTGFDAAAYLLQRKS